MEEDWNSTVESKSKPVGSGSCVGSNLRLPDISTSWFSGFTYDDVNAYEALKA